MATRTGFDSNIGIDYKVFTPDIWSAKVNEFFRAKLVAAPIFDDYSDDVTGGGGTIYIPAVTDLGTADSIATTSGEIDPTTIQDTKSSMTLSNWEGKSFILTDYQKARVANSYKVAERYAKAAAYSVAKKLDTDLLALGSNITPVVGDSGTSLLETSLEKAISIMESHSVPRDELVFIFHPYAYWREIMQNENLVQASKYGRVVLPNPPHNELFGIPVYITPQVPSGTAGSEGGHRNLLIHKDNFVYALANLDGNQSGVRISEKASEHLRTRVTADIMYGKTYLDAKRGVRIISKN